MISNHKQWDTLQVKSWLEKTGLNEVAETFQLNQIDGKALSELNLYWLAEMGITDEKLAERTMNQIKLLIGTKTVIREELSLGNIYEATMTIQVDRSKSDGYSESILRGRKSPLRPSSEIIQSNIQNFFPDLSDDLSRASVYQTKAIHEDEEDEIQWIKGSLIGSGSFAKVFLGLNTKTGEMIAAKQIPIRKKEVHL